MEKEREEALKEELLNSTYNYVEGWHSTTMPSREFFRSEQDVFDEDNIKDKFYAFLFSIQNALAKRGSGNTFEYQAFVEPSINDSSAGILLFRGELCLVLFQAKFWHVWDTEEELKEDLFQSFRHAKVVLEKYGWKEGGNE